MGDDTISGVASSLWVRRAAATAVLALLMNLAHAAAPAAPAHEIRLLWPNGAPGSPLSAGAEEIRLSDLGEQIVSNVHAPSITLYLPQRGKAARTAVIVVPGGGHTELWMDHEGFRVAEWLSDHGIAAFVLKYRLARAKGSPYTVEGHALADAQRAIRLVRSQAEQWGLDPQRIGVMGFSAGGELAALAASRYDGGVADAQDRVERQSSRPSFQALLYPAIPSGLQFSPQTPPAFLLGGADDQAAISQGLAELYLAMRRAGAQAELHIYQGVGHGFGLRVTNKGPVAEWPDRLFDWVSQLEHQHLEIP